MKFVVNFPKFQGKANVAMCIATDSNESIVLQVR